MTNWDRIKLMNAEEAAKELSSDCPSDGEFINRNCGSGITCAECWEKWLNSAPYLKPCPFCGKAVACVQRLGDNTIYARDTLVHPNYYEVVCKFSKGGCGTALGGEYKTEEEAITKWNNRVE